MGARPVLRPEQDESWSAIEGLEASQDAAIRLQWYSEVPGSGAPERLMEAAVQALENRGMTVPGWEGLVEAGLTALEANDMPALIRAHVELQAAINDAERDDTSPYWTFAHYDTWEQFLSDASFPDVRPLELDEASYRDAVYAGWLGQIVGGAVGTSIEGYTAARLREAFGEIRDYLVPPSTYNDDMTFELAFLVAFEAAGREVTAREIGINWVSLIPFGWSAEMVALRNLQAGIVAPESGRTHNPFSEWIGAQMRGAVCGLVAPGNAREAARLAWLDGSVSHSNNGIIGEVFNAALVAGAFVQRDMRALLEETVLSLPGGSEYASVVGFALDRCKRSASWRDAWDACEKRYERYNWVHAYPNACAEVVALWFGAGDFDETLHIIAMEGQDVDCNAAQILTAVAVAGGGAEAIPDRWKEPIGDELTTYVRGMKKLSIRGLAERTVAAARRAGTASPAP